MNLEVMKWDLSICRLEQGSTIPSWALQGEFFNIGRTPDELSVVCESSRVPASSAFQIQEGWSCLKVAGPMDLSLVGVLASLCAPLAANQINIFAISTYDTDYILVPKTLLSKAVSALERAGHQVKRA
jgi:hypothetical protein